MRKKFYQTQEFEKLNREWYKKLKQSGFRDIETENSIKWNQIIPSEGGGCSNAPYYFHQCEFFLNNSGLLTDPLDIFIMEKHIEGLSNRKIEKELESTTFKKLCHQAIDKRLLKILRLAKIKPIKFGGV